MRTTYKITMSDGALLDIADNSAGCAIQTALIRRPGVKVKSCFSGMSEKEAAESRKATGYRGRGFIEHDIPDHDPLTEEQAKEALRKRPKAVDATEAMFDDNEIIGQTQNAKDRFARS